MSDIKWIKISTRIFDDEKFDAIRAMPDGNDIQLAWIKLLCLAGKCNENGFLMVTRELPYTDQMLASHFRMDIGVVQRALDVFQKLEMVEVVDNIYLVSNWAKHQSADRLEEIRRKDRERKREAKQKRLELDAKTEDETDSTEIPRKIHGECSYSSSYSESNNSYSLDSNSNSNNTNNSINTTIDSNSIKNIITAWNSLAIYGIKPIRSISTGSKRSDLLRARIREYGEETILEAIDNIRVSDFLKGKNDRGWMVTFDWFLLPSNFQKVLEGNYDNRKRKGNDRMDMVDQWARNAEQNNLFGFFGDTQGIESGVSE